jgi:capsule biosynthesis phosphatase
MNTSATKHRSIVFDLDDTICFPNHSETDTYEKYGRAAPNVPVIEGMQKLSDAGYSITILSSRRMVTHDGNLVKIIQDVAEITEVWLTKHKVPYDEIKYGKPYSSTYYVDDKAMTPEMFCQNVQTMV